ncbi:MAG TPA: hypothetical protein VFI31_10460 [Pirellulales bacterium]|nr:hypothetical protein [Pirellulales bacterium]
MSTNWWRDISFVLYSTRVGLRSFWWLGQKLAGEQSGHRKDTAGQRCPGDGDDRGIAWPYRVLASVGLLGQALPQPPLLFDLLNAESRTAI